MRVVIDARPLSHPQVGGFRTYVRALVHGLTELNPQDEILLYLDRPLPADAPPLSANMEIRILDQRKLRADWGGFQRQVRRDRPDLVHGTANMLPLGLGVPYTVTIHDAMQIKRYPFMPRAQNLRGYVLGRYEAFLTRRVAGRARGIITVSRFSAQEIGTALRLPPDRIVVVHNGLRPPPPHTERARSEDIVLALASTDRRKNLDLLLRALAPANGSWPRPPRLHIVCTNATSEAYVRDRAQHHGLENMQILRSPDDTGLAEHFAEAAVFVFPSRLEGFGLPPLEAMALGCPVVSSSAPPMPEILGDAPLWFDPDEPAQLSDVLRRLLNDPALRAQAGARGRAQATQFTCRRMAQETLRIWQSTL